MNTRLVDSGQLIVVVALGISSFQIFPKKKKGLAGGTQQTLVNQLEMVAGGKFELTTFGL